MTTPIVNTTYSIPSIERSIQGKDRWTHRILFQRLPNPFQHKSSPLWICRSPSRRGKRGRRELAIEQQRLASTYVQSKQEGLLQVPHQQLQEILVITRYPLLPTESHSTRFLHTNDGVDEVKDGSVQGRFIRIHSFQIKTSLETWGTLVEEGNQQ